MSQSKIIKLDQSLDKNQNHGLFMTMSSASDWVGSFIEKDLFSSKSKPLNEVCEEVNRNFTSNITHAGFIHYLHLCWATEVGCELRPDMIWYTVVSELASLVLSNPERFKNLFNNETIKKNITIVSGSPIINADTLVEAIRNVIANQEFLSDICDVKFESEVENSNYAVKMSFACMATPYFNYFNTLCGIPHVELIGSQEDWNKLYDSIYKLDKYICDTTSQRIMESQRQDHKWISLCKHTVKNIIYYGFLESEESKKEFFSDIFHYGKNTKCGSGHPTNIVLGWAKNFYRVNQETDLSHFKTHVSYVPYTNYDDKVYCHLTCLSHSIKDEVNNTLRPQYGIVNYVIIDDDKANEIMNPKRTDDNGIKYQPLSKKQLIEIIKNGKHYNPAGLHYNRDCRVICDYCRRNTIEECIGYKENNDLCMDCAKELSTKYEVKLKLD